MKKITTLILCLIIVSCGSNSNKKADNENKANIIQAIPVFKFNESLNKNEVMPKLSWNDIGNNIKIIPLETTDKILLTESIKIVYTDEELLIIADMQTNNIYIYDSLGKHKQTIYKKGNGPDEYIHLTHVFFDKTESLVGVFDNGNKKIIYFNLAGKSEKVFSTEGKIKGNIVISNNNKFLSHAREGSAQICIYDENFNVLDQGIPYENWFKERDKSITAVSSGRTQHNFDLYLLNNIYNDTIWGVTEECIKPIAVWEKDNYKLPAEDTGKFPILMKQPPKPNNYIIPRNVDLFSHFILLQYIFKGNYMTDMWNLNTNELEMRFSRDLLTYNKRTVGIPFIFDSGKSVQLLPAYIKNEKIALIIPADELSDDIKDIKEDDNPVLIIMDLRQDQSHL